MDNKKEQAEALVKLNTAFGGGDIFGVKPRVPAPPMGDKPRPNGQGQESEDEIDSRAFPDSRPEKSRAKGSDGQPDEKRAADKGQGPGPQAGGRASNFSPASGETAYFRKPKAVFARRGHLIASKHMEGDIRSMVATRATLAALGTLERVQAHEMAASDVSALEAELVAAEDLVDVD